MKKRRKKNNIREAKIRVLRWMLVAERVELDLDTMEEGYMQHLQKIYSGQLFKIVLEVWRKIRTFRIRWGSWIHVKGSRKKKERLKEGNEEGAKNWVKILYFLNTNSCICTIVTDRSIMAAEIDGLVLSMVSLVFLTNTQNLFMWWLLDIYMTSIRKGCPEILDVTWIDLNSYNRIILSVFHIDRYLFLHWKDLKATRICAS